MKRAKDEGEPQGAIVDTSVLVEYLSLEPTSPRDAAFGHYLEEIVLESKKYQILYISSMTKTELLYISCRAQGWERARTLVKKFLNNFIELHTPEIDELAAQIKSQCPIALSDCFSIAIGSFLALPVYFMKERELTGEIQSTIKEKFDVNLMVFDKQALSKELSSVE